MAITDYVSESGETLYKVYVNIRSKTNSAIRAQRRLAGVKTRREADREETRLIRECEREVNEKESQGSSWGTLCNAWEVYLNNERTDLDDATRTDYVAALRNHTESWWKQPAGDITSLTIKELLNQFKAEGRTHDFQKKFKNMLNRVFNFGMECGLIKGMDKSPACGVKLDKPQEKEPEILRFTEITRLLAEAEAHEIPWYPIWALALLTGMRNGELYALEWKDINWDSKSILVARSYNKRFRKTKSTKGGYWRTVPISTELMELLKELKTTAQKERPHSPYVLPHLGDWQKGMQATELRKFCMSVNLPSVRFHTLRACFATQLIQAGTPAIQLQKICGWKDLKTMQRYIRLAGIEVEGATEQIRLLPRSQPVQTGLTSGEATTASSAETTKLMQSLATSWLPRHLTI